MELARRGAGGDCPYTKRMQENSTPIPASKHPSSQTNNVTSMGLTSETTRENKKKPSVFQSMHIILSWTFAK